MYSDSQSTERSSYLLIKSVQEVGEELLGVLLVALGKPGGTCNPEQVGGAEASSLAVAQEHEHLVKDNEIN